LTSLFPPGAGIGTNHQPYGFDQLKLIYGKYRVLNVRWIINIIGITSLVPFTFNVAPSVQGAANTAELTGELPFSKTVIVNNAIEKRLTGSINCATLFGISHAAYMGDDSFESVVTASPTIDMRLGMLVANYGGVLSAGFMNIELFYDSILFDPIPVAQS